MALWDPPHLWHTSHCVRILHLATVPVTLCKGAEGDNAPHSTHSQEDTHTTTQLHNTPLKRNAHFRHATVSMRLQYTAAPVHTPVKLSCIREYGHTTYIRMYTWTTHLQSLTNGALSAAGSASSRQPAAALCGGGTHGCLQRTRQDGREA